jgi:hypothetical protein
MFDRTGIRAVISSSISFMPMTLGGQAVLSYVPEPAIWASILLGLAVLGATIRIRHRAIRRLREEALAKEEQPDELKNPLE